MIVVSGEALMDVFSKPSQGDTVPLTAKVAGSPLNVALGLARLGQTCGFFGGVSTGVMGELIAETLTRENVSCDFLVRKNAVTTLSLIELNAKGVPAYSFYGDGGADRELALQDLNRVPDAKAFHFGSYAMVVEPTASTLKNLVERQCQRSVIAYDPNVRLNVEPRIGVWRDTLDWMAERSHVIKVSEEDLTLLFPDQNVETIAKSLLRAGTSLVVVTRGEKGCWSWSGVNRFAEVPGQQVALVDTVGAGDAFQAGLLSRLAEKELLKPDGIKQLTPMQLHDVLTFATKTAALACSKRGADLPRRIEVAML